MEYKAFVDFYSKLTTVFHDKNYIVHFVTAGIISPNDVDGLSKLSNNDRAMSLLKNISAPLECGEKQSFYKMLEIMQTHGNHHAQQLTENIKAVVRGVDPGTSQSVETVVTPSEGTYIIELGNISINRQYREPMMRNNQYRRFFEEALISHLQYIAVICNTYITMLQ